MSNFENKAFQYFYQKDYNKAEEICLKEIAKKRNLNLYYTVLADIFMIKGSFNFLNRAEGKKKYINLIAAVGNILKEKSVQHAIELFNIGLKIDENSPDILNSLGIISEKLGDDEAAIEFYEYSLKISKNPATYSNLAFLYNKYDRREEALINIKKAYNLAPKNHIINLGLATMYLQEKDFENGYNYQVNSLRLKNGEKYDIYEKFSVLSPKTDSISIDCNQGLGDTIFMARYIPFLAKYFKHVDFYTQTPLISLLERNFSHLNNSDFSIKFTDRSFAPKNSNIAQAFLLPYYLDMDFEHIPDSNGYINDKKELTEKLYKKFFGNNKLKIGLCWQTGTNQKRGLKDRNVDFETIKVLPQYFKNIQFYSVQKQPCKELEEYNNIIDLSQELDTFEETLSVLKNLDLLISVDTSVSNLAGAAGIKTYLILPHTPEWRWFDGDTSPWYDSLKLFRQSLNGNYSEVVEKIKNNIETELLK